MADLSSPVLVLSRGWVPNRIISLKEAIGELYVGALDIVCPNPVSTIKFEDWIERPPENDIIVGVGFSINRPEVCVMTKYWVGEHRDVGAAFSRSSVFKRDNNLCQYCGKKFKHNELSIDHVVPKSKGGKNGWDNCVTSCKQCNSKKSDKTAGKEFPAPINKPRRPNWMEIINLGPEWDILFSRHKERG